MTKLGITYNIVAGVLSLCTIGGTVAMCVPESQTAIADYTAENLSPKYQETVTLTKEQQSQINNLNFSVENLNSLLTDKQNQLNTANETITNLQNDKTQLENDIETLTSEKAQLQSEVEALENSTGLSYLYTLYSIQVGSIRSDRLGEKLPFACSVFALKYLNDDCMFSKEEYISGIYNGLNFTTYFSTLYNFKDCDVSVYLNNNKLDNWVDYLSSNYEDYDVIQFYLTMSIIENDGVQSFSFIVDLATEPIFSGQFVSEDGKIIDFDTPENTTAFYCGYENYTKYFIGIAYEASYDKIVLRLADSTLYAEFGDNYIIVGDHTYTKVEV